MTDHLTQLRLEDAPIEPELLTPDPLVVRLNKVFSWQQSASRWPYYLARAEEGRAYTKPEIATLVFSDESDHHEMPAGKNWLTSLFGLVVDRTLAEVRLEGVGLFERVEEESNQYCVSSDGLALAHAYSSDRASEDWKRVFAAILARNDPRVRAILLHLCRWSAYLVFKTPSTQGFFAHNSGGALLLANGEEQPLFEYTKGGKPAYSFTHILFSEQYATLGPFLRARIEQAGIQVPVDVKFEGGRDLQGYTRSSPNPEPSSNKLREYMKQALALFRDIGALVYVEHRQGWTLDQERCAALFEPELMADLFGDQTGDHFLEALRSSYSKLSDADGYVRVTEIREYVGDELDISPGERIARFNQQVAYYLRPDVGKLSLGRMYHAQATPEECLFGNLDMEYVELIFPR